MTSLGPGDLLGATSGRTLWWYLHISLPHTRNQDYLLRHTQTAILKRINAFTCSKAPVLPSCEVSDLGHDPQTKACPEDLHPEHVCGVIFSPLQSYRPTELCLRALLPPQTSEMMLGDQACCDISKPGC